MQNFNHLVRSTVCKTSKKLNVIFIVFQWFLHFNRFGCLCVAEEMHDIVLRKKGIIDKEKWMGDIERQQAEKIKIDKMMSQTP